MFSLALLSMGVCGEISYYADVDDPFHIYFNATAPEEIADDVDEYYWAFGDGEYIADEDRVEHIYDYGTFIINVTYRDGDGETLDIESIELTISEPEPEASAIDSLYFSLFDLFRIGVLMSFGWLLVYTTSCKNRKSCR